MKPEDALKKLAAYHSELNAASRMVVAVGLPKEKVTAKVYDGGATVLQIGAIHEFGTQSIPARSFLRVPVEKKKSEVEAFIQGQFKDVLEQERPAKTALNLVGAFVANICKSAFTENDWAPLSPVTLQLKQWKKQGVSVTGKTVGQAATLVKLGVASGVPAAGARPLIDTGTLRASLTWAVRG